MVLRMKEMINERSQTRYRTIVVTWDRTTLVTCTEEDHEFTEEPIPKSDYHPDLYSLASVTTTPTSRDRINHVDVDLIETVFYFLKRTRFLSYSM
jgi:hypothetical protein